MTMKKMINALFALALLFGAASCVEEEKQLEGKPVLSVSSDIIVADGVEELVLTVKVGGVDVTADSKIYVDNQVLEGNRFSTTTAKDYDFFASYNAQISNHVIVTAANPALYVALPEDAQAGKFDDFGRKVLLTQATGTWCGYCPYMIRAIELFCEGGSNAANTVVVATHSGDEFSNSASDAVISAMHVPGYPSSFFNLNPEVLVENAESTVNAEVLNATAGMELMEEARVGIAAATAATADSSMIAVRAAVKVGKKGAYRINAWLVEDGLSAYQSSNWPEFSNGMSTVLIDHDHVLRAASCVSPIQGALLDGKNQCEAGETVEFYYEFNAKSAGFTRAANCKVLVMVTSVTGSKYYVDNIIECPVGESVPFAYNN